MGEELLIVVFEVLVQILAFLPWELLLWAVEKRRGSASSLAVFVVLLGGLLGAAIGGLSLLGSSVGGPTYTAKSAVPAVTPQVVSWT